MSEFFVWVFRKQKNCGDENCPLFKVRSKELTSGNCSFPARTVLKHDVVATHRWAFALNTQQPRVRNWTLTVFSDDLLSIVSLVTGGPNRRPSWVDWIKNKFAMTISNWHNFFSHSVRIKPASLFSFSWIVEDQQCCTSTRELIKDTPLIER